MGSNERSATIQEWARTYEREDVLKYLPYRDFDKGIYATTDDGFGLIISCSPLTSVGESVMSALESAFSILPDNAYPQFLLYASPNITNIVDAWESGKTRNDPISQSLTQSYKEFLETKNTELISPNFLTPISNYRLVIAVKVGGKQKQMSLFDNILDFNNFKELTMKFFKKEPKHSEEEIFDKQMKKNLSEVIAIKERFIGSLKKGYLNPSIMTPNGLIDFMGDLLNQNHDFRNRPKWDGSYLNNFMFANDNQVVVKDNECVIDDKHVRTLSVKEYPEEWAFTDVIKYIGDSLSNQNHASPFLLSLNVRKLDSAKGRNSIMARATATNSQRMPYSLFPKLKYIHKDLEYGMDKLQKGAVPYYFTFQIALFADSEEEADELSGQYKAYFKSLQFKLEDDKYITFPALLSMLPLGYDKTIQEFLSDARGRIVFLDNIISLAPIVADWYGLEPHVPLISPKGQLFGIDLFANKAGGFNAFCVGMTGSGKSVFLQWIALMYYLCGHKIWIIDIGGSYEKICKILGGQYIDFKEDSDISMNPFTDIKDRKMLSEYMEFLVSLYLLMGLPKEETLSKQLENLMRTYLNDAIEKSYSIHENKSDVDTVVEALNKINETENDPRLTDFTRHLKPYQKGNIHGGVLNGESNVNFTTDFTVLEGGTLEQKSPDLLNIVLMVQSYQISKEIYLNKAKDANVKNVVIMDEAHKFLGSSPHIDIFIEQAYRRFRKDGASMILGTQGFEDLYGDGGDNISQVGRVIVQNSYWNFFLMQKSTSREKIKKSGYFALSDYEKSLMDTVEPVDGEYGEVLILSDKITTKGRVVLDDFLKALLFTNADMRIEFERLVASGLEPKEAVEEIMKKGQ